MARSERKKPFKIAFVLTPDNIRAIDSILERVGKDRSFSIRCSDNSTILFDDIEELIGFPNTKVRRIQQLICSASDQGQGYASIEFGVPKSGDVTAEFTVKGDDDKVVVVSNQLEEQILRTKQWYSVVTTGDLFGRLFFVAFFLVLIWGAFEFVVWWSEGFPRIPAPESAERGKLPGGVLVFFLVAGLFATGMIVWGGASLLNALFPKGEIGIGDGETRIGTARFWRRVAGTGVLLALIVTLLGTGLSNWIFS